MPNHVTNIIEIKAEPSRIKDILAAIQDDEKGIGSIDFNKLRPMPKSIEDVEVGDTTDRAINLYLTYINPMVDYFGPQIDLTSVDSIVHFQKHTISGNEFAKIYNRFNEEVRFYRFNGALSPHEVKENVERILGVNGQNIKSLEDIIAYGESLYKNIQEHGNMNWYNWAVKHWGTKWNAYQFGGYEDGSNKITFMTAWSAPRPAMKTFSEKFPDVEFSHSWADDDLGHNVGMAAYKAGEIVSEHEPEGGSAEAYEMAAEIHGESLESRGLYKTPDGRSYEYREEEDSEDLEV